MRFKIIGGVIELETEGAIKNISKRLSEIAELEGQKKRMSSSKNNFTKEPIKSYKDIENLGKRAGNYKELL